MSDLEASNSGFTSAGSQDSAEDVPRDVRELDLALGRLLSPLAEEAAPGLTDRVFEASVKELPTRVLPFQARSEDQSPGFRIPYLGYAAMILVAVLSYVVVTTRDQGLGIGDESAAGNSMASQATFVIDEPRDSEAMLMAVLDPSEDWFGYEDDLEDPFISGVGAVLQTRGFGVNDLSGDVIAMLGGTGS